MLYISNYFPLFNAQASSIAAGHSLAFKKLNNKTAIVAFIVLGLLATCLAIYAYKTRKIVSENENQIHPNPQTKIEPEDKAPPVAQLTPTPTPTPKTPTTPVPVVIIDRALDFKAVKTPDVPAPDLANKPSTPASATIPDDVFELPKTVDSPKKSVEPVAAEGRTGESILGTKTFSLGAKIWESSSVGEMPEFTELSKIELEALLDSHPDLKEKMVAQGHVSAYNSIFNIHQNGIPAKLMEGSEANNLLKRQMQFLVKKISEADGKERDTRFEQLIMALEDCVPVTQGRMNNLVLKELGAVGFASQLSYMLDAYKKEIFEATIYEIFPEMQDPNYAQKFFSRPSKQFPHVCSAFLVQYGKEFGLQTIGAATDPNADTDLADEHEADFKKVFTEKMQAGLQGFVKEFILDVNGNTGHHIKNNNMFDWIGTQEDLRSSDDYVVLDDPNYAYPAYYPKKPEGPAAYTQVYMTEGFALQVLEKLGILSAI